MDVVEKNEGKLPLLQTIGFCILMLGLIAFIVTPWLPSHYEPSVAATAFFITMLGFAFAFPSLLEGNEGLSTMRIIVFMMTLVICMLLLKIGWSTGIDSLADIGLNASWVGVIAFVFGAKATQSFFESKFATPPTTTEKKSDVGMAAVPFASADIARLAKNQNEEFLYARFPNIMEVSDAVDDSGSEDSHVVAIYISDNNTKNIPDRLEAKMPDGTVRIIPTEIIKEVGRGKIQLLQRNRIINAPDFGSICCLVATDTGENKVVTSGHVFSKGDAVNYGGELDPAAQTETQIDGIGSGKWFFQMLNYNTDVALASVEVDPSKFKDFISFKTKGYYSVTDADVRKTQVTVVSNVFDPQTRTGYILDYNTAWDVRYDDKSVTKSEVIVIGSAKNRRDSKTVSEDGDSGGCVYETQSGKLVGLILGGNRKFTWVLPVEELFENHNYKLL